ncbi:MAG TPA: DUF3857 domain-containing protein [Puia sp.]|nr:DUF3857 domain-containing protein [Puia sp.]
MRSSLFRFVSIQSLLLLLISTNLFAQDQVAEEPEFKITAVPDKWKSESAVILAQKIDYAYVRKAMTSAMTIREYVRKRIRLQDKNALENFSEFYYATYGKKTAVNYSIIKSSGKVVNVDLSNAIEVDKDVPGVFKPIYLRGNTSFFKIAIPDLEIGDIVDYHFESAEDMELAKGYGEFTPYIFTLTYNYPVLYQKFQFDLDKGTDASFKSYNGAPILKEGDGGFDTKASDKKSLVSYFIIDKNREKTSDERWNYEYRNSPTVKLKITYKGGGLSNTLFGKKGEATAETVSLDQLRGMYSSLQYYTSPLIEGISKDIVDYLKNNGKDNLPPKQMVHEIYYVFRKIFLESYYKGQINGKDLDMFGPRHRRYSKDSKKKDTEKEDQVTVNRLIWAAVLCRTCIRKDLGVEVLAIMPRYLGKWNDMLFREELELAMRVKGDKYYFMFPFDNFDLFAQPDENFDGADAYAFAVGPKSDGYYKANIPSSTFDDNVQKQESMITIPETMDLLQVERTNSYSGMEKSGNNTLAHLDREYLNTDFKKYIINPKKDKGDNNYVDADKDERKKTQMEYLKKSVENDGVEVEKYDKFELVQDGRFDETPMLVYKENFSLKKLLNKAGRNYLLDAGKLIGGQIKLEEKEMKTRDNDIWISHARTIINNITIVLPKGYTADGLQDLNYNVNNESGSFISSAKIDGGKLILSTQKIYKKNFDKKDAWPNYVAFLEAAYKFTQVKVVLKKQQ